MPNKPDPDPIDLIPAPQEVRDCLARRLREADLLRAQLRVSRRAAIERQQNAQDGQGVDHDRD